MSGTNFLSLGIASGQPHPGLRHSPMKAYADLSARHDLHHAFKLDVEPHRAAVIFKERDLHQLPLSIFQQAYLAARQSQLSGNLSLFWGGDHSLALATVQSFLDVYPEGRVLWVDAHTDINLPKSTLSGNFHGMPVSYLMGLSQSPIFQQRRVRLRPAQLCYLGIRSLDPFEKDMVECLQIPHFSRQWLHRWGMPKACEWIQDWIQGQPLHVSFDIDAVDPQLAPSTGVPVSDGLQIEELNYLSQFLSHQSGLRSLDIVEINPEIGTNLDVQNTYDIATRFLEPILLQQRRSHVYGPTKFERELSTPQQRYLSFSTAISI